MPPAIARMTLVRLPRQQLTLNINDLRASETVNTAPVSVTETVTVQVMG